MVLTKIKELFKEENINSRKPKQLSRSFQSAYKPKLNSVFKNQIFNACKSKPLKIKTIIPFELFLQISYWNFLKNITNQKLNKDTIKY